MANGECSGIKLEPAKTADASERAPLVIVHDPTIQQRENRIEALRAASRVMAGFYTRQYTDDSVTLLAEQFANWLETGTRDGQK